MSINTSSIRAISLTEGDLESIQEANKAFEMSAESTKEINFIEDADIIKLMSVTTKLGELSLKDKILLANGWSKKLNGEYVYPHVTELAEGDIVYQHCIYLSALRSFSPVLAMPHSGQGFSTVKEWGIKHPAVLSFDVTVGGLDITELDEDDEELSTKEMHAKKVATALGRITLKWCAPDSKEWKEYTVGACIPEGSAAYQVGFEDVKATGAPIQKEGFSFVVTRKPVVKPEDVTLVGKASSCTQARVKIKVWGTWLGNSQAEKFASTLSKLCVDAMPETNTLEDTMAGGICLFDAPKGNFTKWCQTAVKGEVKPLPLTDVGLGQETAKGAPTYNPAAAVIKVLTGKHVKRQTYAMHQPVKIQGEVQQFPIGDVVWDSDEFIQFRNAWNKAAIATGVWARWTDDVMLPILKKAIKYEETLAKAKALQAEGKKAEASALWESYPYRFVAAGTSAEEGYYFFHKAEVRVELAPLTMETSTQKENLSAKGSGSMFWELCNGLGQI